MKFSIISTILLGSTAVLSAPILERRQDDVLGDISGALDRLEGALAISQGAIDQAISDAEKGLKATSFIAAAIEANAPAIVNALGTAGSAMSVVTTSPAGQIVAGAISSNDEARSKLTKEVQRTQDIAQKIQDTIDSAVASLSPEEAASIKSAVTTIKKALAPFLMPLQEFAATASSAGDPTSAAMSGLLSATQGLQSATSVLGGGDLAGGATGKLGGLSSFGNLGF